MAKKVIVIASGLGGLAVTCRLAARGHEVEIFEKRDKAGGRAYVYERDGLKFDGGPTVITAPFMFDDIFAAAGERRDDYRVDATCGYIILRGPSSGRGGVPGGELSGGEVRIGA